MSLPPSVIHPPPSTSQDEIISDDEARKRREFLERRPSYRKILNDLSAGIAVKKEPDGGSSLQVPEESMSVTRPIAVVEPANASLPSDVAVSFPGAGVLSAQLHLPNGDLSLGGLAGGLLGYGPTVSTHLSNAPTPDSHLSIVAGSVNDVLGMRQSANSPLSISTNNNNIGMSAFVNQGLMPAYSAGSPSPLGSMGSGSGNDEVTRKRQMRLLKNREAAKECRRKKKEYVKCLENRVAVLENQNKALIEELKTLKDLYCRKDKGE